MKRKSITFLSLTLLSILFATCKKSKADPPPPDPVALYKFDNNFKNSVSNLLHGTLVGNALNTTDSFNTANAAVGLFAEGYVKVPDSDIIDFPGNQFTFAVWIRPSKTTQTYIINKADDNNSSGGPYLFSIFPGHLYGAVRTNTAEQFQAEGATPILKNVWQHVAFTLGNGKLSVYYNGELDGSADIDRPVQITAGDLAIGGYIWAFPAGSWEGKLDNLYIFDKALSAGQIRNLYKKYK